MLLPIGDIKPSLYRLYCTVEVLKQAFWGRQRSRFLAPFRWRALLGSEVSNWGALTPPVLRSLEAQARRIANQLPKQSCDILAEALKVLVFGETKPFDHLDFSAWFNGFFEPDTHYQSVFYESFAPYLSNPTKRRREALEQWVSDLAVMAQLVARLRGQCASLSGFADIRAEHIHLKSWQVRGYKAHWWHLDRGEISAIATVAGHPTTEFLLADDPAPYPEQPAGYDVFVFPEQLDQLINQCPSDDVLLCGARARKERNQSYLWHRAPESQVERIVLVLKTRRHFVNNENAVTDA